MCEQRQQAAVQTTQNTTSGVDVSVVIVSFNTRDLTLACLRSVFEQTSGLAFEVILVDNASGDGSAQAVAQEYPQVKLLALEQNLGFARANNLASRHAKGEYLVLLNPDTVVLDNAIQRLHAFASQHPKAVVFGGRSLTPDGELDPTCCFAFPSLWSAFCISIGLSPLWPGSRIFDPESLGAWRRDSVRKVDVIKGCFLLVRQSAWERLGGFDSRFFLYGEETDFCWRARKELGVRAMFCPDAAIVHYGGASEPVRADALVRLFRAKAQLFSRHWSRLTAAFGVTTLDLWAFTRMLAYGTGRLVRARYAEAYQTWRSVWRRRQEWRSVATIMKAATVSAHE